VSIRNSLGQKLAEIVKLLEWRPGKGGWAKEAKEEKAKEVFTYLN
jgi:hypothetical protein